MAARTAKPPKGGTRGANGRFTRNLTTAERDAEAVRLRSTGMPLDEITRTLGYASNGATHDGIGRTLASVAQPAADAYRALEDVRLDAALAKAFQVLHADHPLVSQGRRFNDLQDAGPVLAAIREIVRISARRSALHVLDAPTRSRVEVLTESMVDAEIERLTDVLNEHAQAGSRSAAG
jgi:hypothetical protein